MAFTLHDQSGPDFHPSLYRLPSTPAQPAKAAPPPAPTDPEPAPTAPPARDYDSFRALLNNRRMELNLSMLDLDHIAELPGGYSSKILASTRRKGGAYSNIGPESMGKLLRALGVQIRLEQAQDCEDSLPSGIDFYPHLQLLRERARRGGIAAYSKMGVCKRAAFHRKGGLARGKARRKASKQKA